MTSERSLQVRVPGLTSPGEGVQGRASSTGKARVSGTSGLCVGWGTVPATRWGEWMGRQRGHLPLCIPGAAPGACGTCW